MRTLHAVAHSQAHRRSRFAALLTLALGHSNLSRYYASGQIVSIIVFGLIWLVPAALLIRWMQRPDGRAN